MKSWTKDHVRTKICVKRAYPPWNWNINFIKALFCLPAKALPPQLLLISASSFLMSQFHEQGHCMVKNLLFCGGADPFYFFVFTDTFQVWSLLVNKPIFPPKKRSKPNRKLFFSLIIHYYLISNISCEKGSKIIFSNFKCIFQSVFNCFILPLHSKVFLTPPSMIVSC